MGMLAVLQQTDAIAGQLDRMGTMITVIAVSAVVVGLLSAITLVISLFTMRSASKLMKNVESHLDRLAPKTDPLIEKMTRLVDDARGVTDGVRRRVTDLMDTVADVNDALRKAHRAADTRVREFTAVLDVVQSEAEEVLLDGAATARGLHATAEALRAGAAPRPSQRHGIPRHAMDAHADGLQPDRVNDTDTDEGATESKPVIVGAVVDEHDEADD
jgi:uncharacterized protein YoxC